MLELDYRLEVLITWLIITLETGEEEEEEEVQSVREFKTLPFRVI